MSDNFNNNYMEDVFWDGLFEMAENYEEQEESPIYENINFYGNSMVKDGRYHTPEEALKVLF